MLIIRLQRTGRKHEPTFRVVLTDSKNSTKSGKFLEILGSYDARDKNETKFNGDRIKEWIEKGAQVSDTVHNLLVDRKIIEGKKINVLPKKSPIKKEGEGEETAEAAPEAPVAEAPAAGEKPAEEVKEEPAPEEKPAEEAPATEEVAPAEEKPAEEATPKTPAEEQKEESPAEQPEEEKKSE